MTCGENPERGSSPLTPRPGRETWDRPPMREALARRDIGVVYTLLQSDGYTQADIGRWAGQSQPEVSAIIKGRQVMAYDVLLRIADGLGIPRGYLSLSSCTEHDQ